MLKKSINWVANNKTKIKQNATTVAGTAAYCAIIAVFSVVVGGVVGKAVSSGIDKAVNAPLLHRVAE